jgi:hypothetical protein
MLAALDSPKWHTAYTKDLRTRRPAAPAAHEKHGGKKDAPPAQQAAPQAAAQPAADDSAPKKSGNPNFNPSLNDNPDHTPCTRCHYDHKWLPPLCTSVKDKEGNVISPALAPEEVATRLKARYDRGFFFKHPLKPSKQSPSAAESAEKSRQAAAALSNSSKK